MHWKSEEEVCTDSSYVQQCSAQARANTCIWYFYCNQSGVYQSKGLRKRALKLQGSCKLGEFCTAHISQNKSGGNVTIKYCPTHHNHEPRNDISHLRLPENERLSIAAKLMQGVTIDKILDDTRDNVFETGLQREHLTSKQGHYQH